MPRLTEKCDNDSRKYNFAVLLLIYILFTFFVLGVKKKILQLLSCYNSQWLRIGLEAVYNEDIAIEPRADVGGLGRFVRRRLLSNSVANKKKTNSKVSECII